MLRRRGSVSLRSCQPVADFMDRRGSLAGRFIEALGFSCFDNSGQTALDPEAGLGFQIWHGTCFSYLGSAIG